MDMKTRLHLGTDEARSLLSSPLTLLAWLEATALKSSLSSFLRRSRVSDRWYLCRSNETSGPVGFGEILSMLLRGEGPVHVLHESEAASEPAPWHALDYRAWPVNPAAALAWIGGTWLFTVALGYVVITLLCPVGARTIVGIVYLVAVLAAAIWIGLSARGRALPVKQASQVE